MIRKLVLYVICMLYSFSSYAQETFPANGTSDPRHITYAFTNATIFTDYKTKISPATLLIRDGIIIDAGEKVSIPADAVINDLKGNYIYPSFVDIFSDYGLPEVKKPKPNEGPQYLSAQKGAYNWNQAVRAEYDAYRNFIADPLKAAEYRKMGFGTVMSINRDGIVRGTSVIALLSDGNENEMILRNTGASNFSFDKGSSTQDYPSSLMGAIALIRQTYLDAQWYQSGGDKKEFNITLDAFNKLRNLPQVFEAGDEQNELRASLLGKEWGHNYIIKGIGNEYERINEIKASGNAFIVPLNFPEAFDLSDPYDAINVSLKQLKNWELAPLNPSLLAQNQVEFALTTSDLKNKNDFFKNLRKALDNGFTAEDALKSLTYTPAKMLGMENRVGQLKKGMLANFIITSNKLFEKDFLILENWVQGAPYIINHISIADIRGNYSFSAMSGKSFRVKLSGELYATDAHFFEDTAAAKLSFSRQGNTIAFQFELKKTEPKGVYRANGVYNESKKTFSGNILGPSGEWSKFSMQLDSVFVAQPSKKDTADKVATGPVFYPNMAYGWKELPQAKSFVIRNATVWTNEDQGILENTDVYVSEGKIKSIGKKLIVPSGVEEINGAGKHLTSGIIDEHSHIAISGSVNEGTQASSAEVRIGDVVDADDIEIYRQLAGGVTTSHLLHGSSNPIGGQTQIIKLRWGLPSEKLKFENAPRFIKFALGENVKQSNWGEKQASRFPQTRQGVEQVYVDFFTRAKEYGLERKKYLAAENNKRADVLPVRRNLELDALSDVINNKLFITCHSYVQSEINMLMHVADSFGFTVNTFTHILEGFKVADKMKAHGVKGASSFSDWWAYKFEVYEAIPHNGAILHKMGINVSFNSDDPEMARRLNQEAAKAVKYGGVSEIEAWKFVTLNPAKMLHIDDRVGSIRVGKDADLVIWSDNPLSIYARALQTYVDGVRYYDAERDLENRKLIALEKQRIMKKMDDAKSKGESVKKPGMSYMEINHCEGSERMIMNKIEIQ